MKIAVEIKCVCLLDLQGKKGQNSEIAKTISCFLERDIPSIPSSRASSLSSPADFCFNSLRFIVIVFI